MLQIQHIPKNPYANGLICLAFLMAMPLGSSQAYAQSNASDEPGAETVENATSAEPDGEEVDSAPPTEDWSNQVDQFFGDYLVAPLNTVLFYDFGTGERWGDRMSIPFVVVWLFLGSIFFTIRMGFINVRAFKHAILVTMGRYDDPNDEGEVSHFQALSSALSATVGLGNIAGVAIAVGLGGPGAIVWMVLTGLIGMSSKFTECSLGQMYRHVALDGTVSGGPMHYLRKGLTEMSMQPLGVFLAGLFTLLCIGASFGGGCTFQVVQSLGAIREEVLILKDYGWIYGIVMVILCGLVIIGGIRRIAATAEKIVPLMCGIYVLMALYVIFSNYQQIVPAFQAMLFNAFTPEATYGGFIGVLVTGIQRAAFSNEAGIGSAAIAHSAAKTDEPIREGIVALLEPFIDTVVICTITGLVIVITGVYNDPQYAELVAEEEGAALTSAAVGSVSAFFPKLLAFIVFMFAFSTLISWSYYGERCSTHLFGPRASLPYKLLFLTFVMLGSIVSAGNILAFSDLMLLSMALPNILGAALLSGKVRRRLDQYWEQYRSGAMETTGRS